MTQSFWGLLSWQASCQGVSIDVPCWRVAHPWGSSGRDLDFLPAGQNRHPAARARNGVICLKGAPHTLPRLLLFRTKGSLTWSVQFGVDCRFCGRFMHLVERCRFMVMWCKGISAGPWRLLLERPQQNQAVFFDVGGQHIWNVILGQHRPKTDSYSK